MPSRIQPATSSAIAAAISTCAMLRRIRSRSERIFAITGSAEMLERRAHEQREDVARRSSPPTKTLGQREAERRRPRARAARGCRSRRAPSRGRAAGSARGRSRARSGSSSRNTPIQAGPASRPRWSGSGGNSQPWSAGREVAEHARPEQQAGRELADHRGLPDCAHHRRRARGPRAAARAAGARTAGADVRRPSRALR